MTRTPDMDRSLLCWALQPNLQADGAGIALGVFLACWVRRLRN